MSTDLTAAIEAGTAALDGMELHPRIGMNPGGFVLDLPRADIAATAITAAAPLIEQAVLAAAAQLLCDWADENPDPDWSSARAARRRTLHAAARKITPKMTDAEAAKAFVDLMEGRAPGFVCHLDAPAREQCEQPDCHNFGGLPEVCGTGPLFDDPNATPAQVQP